MKRNLRNKYGISLDEYLEQLEKQNGVCAICKKTCSTGTRLCQDHNHDTNSNRGLLCRACNMGIGCFKDDPLRLESALRYLADWS